MNDTTLIAAADSRYEQHVATVMAANVARIMSVTDEETRADIAMEIMDAVVADEDGTIVVPMHDQEFGACGVELMIDREIGVPLLNADRSINWGAFVVTYVEEEALAAGEIV
jgi:hypothetical protein